MRNPQANLFDQIKTPSEKRELRRRVSHGGGNTRGKRKLSRPIATKKWMHLVLKSDVARGKLSMLAQKNARFIDQVLKEKAKKFGVELKDFVNMGNHLHIQVRASSRKGFQNFLRAITTLIARHITGAKKGKKFGKFWSGLAFTRIITSFIELAGLVKYFEANRIQRSKGYAAREKYLSSANEWLQSLAT